MFDMSNDSHLFRTREQLEAEGCQLEGNVFKKDGEEYLPLYEAKMIHHFDHRWATYDGLDTRDVELIEKQQPYFVSFPRYWVKTREVKLCLAALPKGLVQALRENSQSLIILALTHLLFGRWLIEKGFSLEKAVMREWFPAWSEFVDRYPFTRTITPTQMGLCGNNEACLQPLGPNYLPASPIDQIKNDERRSTACIW